MLRVLIVDDEAPARARLRNLLAPLLKGRRVELVGEATDGLEALKLVEAQAVDLLLLDIRMPGLDGFELLERIDPSRRPEVVFVTAHDDYAVRAFEAHALDYLLKPVSRDRLAEAVSRVERIVSESSVRHLSDERLGKLLDWIEQRQDNVESKQADREPIRQLSVPYRDRVLIVPVEDLLAAEISDGLTRVVLLEDPMGHSTRLTKYVVNYTLDQLEARLDPDDFLRVHRSTIVAVKHIREMVTWFSGRYKIKLSGGFEAIASRERSRALRQRLSL